MKKNEIVTVINDFIDLPLKNFTPSEMNLLTTFLARCKNEGTDLVEIDFSEIREIAKYTYRGQKELVTDIVSTNNKLQTLKFAFEMEPGVLRQLVLFPTFDVDTNAMKLRIRVNEDFKYILNDFDYGFTTYEASIHNGLNSRFSKMVFKQLRKFKSTGLWSVSLAQFRELLDIPVKYRQTDIDNRVLKPVREELSPLFADFRIEKKYEKSHRGRPTVNGYEFRWDPKQTKDRNDDVLLIPEDSVQFEVLDEKPSKKNAPKAEKTDWICPECGRALYKKEINGSICYCHPDGWKEDSVCKKIYNDISDIQVAVTRKEYGAASSKFRGSSEVSSILTDVIKDMQKGSRPAKDRREELIKAVPSLITVHAGKYFSLLSNVEDVEKSGDENKLAEAIRLARHYQEIMEAEVIKKGFSANDLYEYIFKDETSQMIRNSK